MLPPWPLLLRTVSNTLSFQKQSPPDPYLYFISRLYSTINSSQSTSPGPLLCFPGAGPSQRVWGVKSGPADGQRWEKKPRSLAIKAQHAAGAGPAHRTSVSSWHWAGLWSLAQDPALFWGSNPLSVVLSSQEKYPQNCWLLSVVKSLLLLFSNLFLWICCWVCCYCFGIFKWPWAARWCLPRLLSLDLRIRKTCSSEVVSFPSSSLYSFFTF